MQNQQDDQDGRGVSFKGNMRVQWEERSADMLPNQLEADAKNERLLKAMLFSQDLHHEQIEAPDERTTADLIRVEAKLDLLLDMVSQLLRSDQADTPETQVIIWLSGASWITTAKALPSPGERLWLSLYIDSRLAQPLRLPVRVTDVRRNGGQAEITVAFDSLVEPVEDLLGKLVFRQHRRMIAQQKAEKRGGTRE